MYDDEVLFEEVFRSYCPECGTEHQIVRPGKTQPNCDCHLKCPCGGMITYHGMGSDPKYPNWGGDWCDTCGPFGELEDGNK